MGFDVSALSDYTNEQSRDLISRLYFENTSAQNMTIQAGIKSSEALQIFGVSAIPQSDAGCGFNASGDVTFSQRNITVGSTKYQDTLCMQTLNAKWTQILLRQGVQAAQEDINGLVAQGVANDILMQVKEDIERMDWQGDTASGDAYLNKYDGLIKLIDAAGTAVDGNTSSIASGTGITKGSSGNADTIVYNMCDARPAKLKRKDDQVLFCGTDTFDKVVDTLIQKNNFHIDVTAWQNYSMRIPGRNVTLIGVHGLDGTDRLFLGQRRNFYIGVDATGDEDQFRIWYSEDDDNVKYSVRYKRGTQVAYPDEIVEFELA